MFIEFKPLESVAQFHIHITLATQQIAIKLNILCAVDQCERLIIGHNGLVIFFHLIVRRRYISI